MRCSILESALQEIEELREKDANVHTDNDAFKKKIKNIEKENIEIKRAIVENHDL